MTRYLVVKGHSGMGNRVTALLQAIVYARLTGRRLVVDWNDFRYSPGGSDVFRHLFDCPIASGIEALPDGPSVVPAAWVDVREPMQAIRRRYGIRGGGEEIRSALSIDTARLDYPEQVAVFFDFAFKFRNLERHAARFPPAWRDLGGFELARRLVSEHLEVSPSLLEAVAEFRQQRFGARTIGVHARQTDNVEPRMLHKKKAVSLPALERAVEECVQAEPEATLLVATDNRSVLEAFRARYERTVWFEKWFPEDGGPLHGHKGCPDKLAMAGEALIEIALLSECDVLVHSSRSSFSRLARLLARNPSQRNVDVEPREGSV